MLTQEEIDKLLNIIKEIESSQTIIFPGSGSEQSMDINSKDKKYKFIIKVNRKGKISKTKCTYLELYRKTEGLLRLDINASTHRNPDGTKVGKNHLHTYREGNDDSWAIEIPTNFINTKDLVKTLRDFLEYCKIENYNDVKIQDTIL